jgi:hypothetical protein
VYRVPDGFVLCSVSCISVFCWLVSGNTTQGFYFVFIRSLEPFYIPCYVLQYGHLGYGHSCVYVICVCVCVCVLTNNRQCLIFVVLIHITIHLIVCIHLTLGSHLALCVRLTPHPKRFHVRSISAHCMLKGLNRNVGAI